MYKYFCLIPILLLAACSASKQLNNHSLESIPLELTTHLGDQQQFVEGDEIQFLLSLGSDAYIYMYYIDARNNLTQILPNPNQTSNYYTAGYFLTIPEYNNGYRFTISEPYGEEAIWVFASDRLVALTGSYNSIDEVKQKVKATSKGAFGEYLLKITTSKK